jgi:FkbM family methyltransferase
MNIKLITNNMKDIVEEVFFGSRIKRELIRSSRYFSNMSYIEMKSMLRDNGIDLVLDVGANSGQFYLQLRKQIGYTGKVFSFEPNPAMQAGLQKLKAADDNFEVFPHALGASESTLQLNVYKDSKLSSFLQGSDKRVDRFKDKFTTYETVEVPIKTLDGFFAARPELDAASVFLKMDTQGFDLEVLKGLQQHRDKVKFIQSELSVIPLYENMPHYTESINFFEAAGYRVISLIPVTREKNKNHVIEFDAVWGKVGQ